MRSGDEVLIFETTAPRSLEETKPDSSPSPNDVYGMTAGLSWPILVIAKQSQQQAWFLERRKLPMRPAPWP